MQAKSRIHPAAAFVFGLGRAAGQVVGASRGSEPLLPLKEGVEVSESSFDDWEAACTRFDLDSQVSAFERIDPKR